MTKRTYSFLIAEDEHPIRNNLIGKIKKMAPDFVLKAEASSGKSAWELVKSSRPDVVFTDIRMPGMDGLELMKSIRQHFPDVYMVVISGYNDFEYARQSIRSGVSDYLLKPVDPEKLRECLGRIREILRENDAHVDNEITPYNDAAVKDLASRTDDIIREQFRDNLTVGAIADRLRVNPTYLSRTYKSIYGITPSRSLQNRRIDLAKRLLGQYDHMEIKEIAAFIGYQDQNYFSRVFKKQTGMSPGDYRDRI